MKKKAWLWRWLSQKGLREVEAGVVAVEVEVLDRSRSEVILW